MLQIHPVSKWLRKIRFAERNIIYNYIHSFQKRSKDLKDALEWLKNAGLINKLDLVTTPEFPLAFNADANYFKIYMADVGLLCRRCGLTADTVLEENAYYKNFKGAFTENFVLTELPHVGIKPYFCAFIPALEYKKLSIRQDSFFIDNPRILLYSQRK